MNTSRIHGLPLLVPVLALLSASSMASPHHVLVETEAFDSIGGWVIDQQFMDLMGSPYLLAHGMGRPVADASTTVTFPEPGRYRA